jgi:hypothetical protein
MGLSAALLIFVNESEGKWFYWSVAVASLMKVEWFREKYTLSVAISQKNCKKLLV